MKIKTTLRFIFFVFLGLFPISAHAQVIRIGISAAYEPFEFRDAKKNIVGFDVDIAKAICTELKWSCIFSDHAFDTLVSKLEKNRIDLIVSAFDITPEASKHVKFSTPYFYSGAILIAAKGRFKTATDLQNKKVGVLKGRIHKTYIDQNFPGFAIKDYNHIPSSLKDLVAGNLDAVFIDDSIGTEFLKKNPTFEVVGDMINDKSYFDGGFAIAARLDDNEKISKINNALKSITNSGKYQQIYDSWFSDTEWLSISVK